MGGISGRVSEQRRTARTADALAVPVQRTAAPVANAAPRHWTGIADTPVEHPNRTGLPDRLKSGIEKLSGVSLDDVRVHRNSSRPAKLQAQAFAQGKDIHVAPGQERTLPHEAWHIVQQKQGRVQTTSRGAGGTPLNESKALEQEADVMGARAELANCSSPASEPGGPPQDQPRLAAPAQLSRGSKGAEEELEKALGKKAGRVDRLPAARPHRDKSTGKGGDESHQKRNAYEVNKAVQDTIFRTGDPGAFSASRMRSDDRAVEKDADARERREEKASGKRATKEDKIREYYGLGPDDEITRDHRKFYDNDDG